MINKLHFDYPNSDAEIYGAEPLQSFSGSSHAERSRSMTTMVQITIYIVVVALRLRSE